jgi:hypothetical protein
MPQMLGRVFIFAKTKNPPKAVLECVHGVLQVIHVSDPVRWPPQCHFYVTKATPNEATWRAAHAMSPIAPVVLPEAGPWLYEKINDLTAAQQDVYIFVASGQGDRL